MTNVYLVCNAGMSTGILQMKLEDEAKRLELDMKVEAIPITDVKEVEEIADVILLGPQIRFAYDDLKSTMPNACVLQITPQDFGMMNAKVIMKNIIKNIKDK